MDIHGLLVVDKPRGLTSHDVVARIRRLLSVRRVGHAGTLDPAAEGVLVVAVGTATRLINHIQDTSKEYLAHIAFGVQTDSADIEGEPIEVASAGRVPSETSIAQALRQFHGTLTQTPPVFSAVKVAGEPLHRRARRGEKVQALPRNVTINAANLLAYEFPDALVQVDCEKGVYIRSIARDLGDAVGSPAYLHYLLRTRVGAFGLDQAWTMDELEQGLRPERWGVFALHPDAAIEDTDAIILDQSAAQAWYHGRPVHGENVTGIPGTPQVRAYRWDGEWLGLGVSNAGGRQWQPRLVSR